MMNDSESMLLKSALARVTGGKLRILNIIADIDPKSGGPIEGLRATSEILEKRGHTIEIATLEDPSISQNASISFPVHAKGPAPKKYGYTPKLTRWIRDHGNEFDVAVIHGLWNHASIGGWLGLKRARIPYVVFTHGMMDPWFRKAYPLKHMAKQLLWFLAQGKVLRDAAAVVFTCEEEQRLARGIFLGYSYREKVVAFGTDEPPAKSQDQDDKIYELLPKLGRDKRFLLFLSRIHPKKGCDMLIEAFSKLSSDFPDLDLVIAGPDQEGLTSQLQAMVRKAGVDDRVHWPGMLSGASKWGAFRNADAFILPSHQENFGIVVAEAMACGTPVLVTDKVNIWRDVQISGGGFIEADTVEGVYNLMVRWLSLDCEERRSMAKKARIGYERHFTTVAAANDLERLLLEAVAIEKNGDS